MLNSGTHSSGRFSLQRMALLLGILAVIAPSLALAEPKTGLGLYAGVAQQSGSQTVQGFSGSTSYHTDPDLGLGLDFQFKLGSMFSLALFYEYNGSSTVKCSGCGSNTKVSSDMLGLEGRFWFDAIFVGLRAGAMSEDFETSGGAGSSFSGSGAGLSAGWEGSGGLFVKFAYDLASSMETSKKPKTTDDVSFNRLFVGYRFGGN